MSISLTVRETLGASVLSSASLLESSKSSISLSARQIQLGEEPLLGKNIITTTTKTTITTKHRVPTRLISFESQPKKVVVVVFVVVVFVGLVVVVVGGVVVIIILGYRNLTLKFGQN